MIAAFRLNDFAPRAIAGLLALLAAAGSASAGGDEPAAAPEALLRAAVETRLAEALGRPATAGIEFVGTDGRWRFVCGAPTEPGGAAFDLAGTPLADNEFGADFCALVELGPASARVVEFEIGSNDMPYAGWVESRGLSPDLLGPP